MRDLYPWGLREKIRAFDFGFLPIGENDRVVGTDEILRIIAEGKDVEYCKTCKTRNVMNNAFWLL